MSTKLFVGNLSFKITEAELQDLFSQAGAVSQVNVIMDKMTMKPRGFAFVTMADEAGAQEAIRQLNGQEVQGRKITVNEARPQEDRPRRQFQGSGDRPRRN